MNFLKSAATLCSLLVMSLFAQGEPLAVGAPAPEVSAPDQNGKTVNLKDLYAQGPVLVYFYPKSDTPGCTKQACSIRDDWKALQEKGIQVVGISSDKVEAQKAFADKYSLPFTVLSDPEQKVAQAFGSPNRARNSFLIKDGKIVWTMIKASTQTHAGDVLKAWEEVGKKS